MNKNEFLFIVNVF